jgi:hypothetical protein
MGLWHDITGITGITGIIRFCGGPRKSLIARRGPARDYPETRAGGGRLVVMAALLSRAGGEPDRWSL